MLGEAFDLTVAAHEHEGRIELAHVHCPNEVVNVWFECNVDSRRGVTAKAETEHAVTAHRRIGVGHLKHHRVSTTQGGLDRGRGEDLSRHGGEPPLDVADVERRDLVFDERSRLIRVAQCVRPEYDQVVDRRTIGESSAESSEVREVRQHLPAFGEGRRERGAPGSELGDTWVQRTGRIDKQWYLRVEDHIGSRVIRGVLAC